MRRFLLLATLLLGLFGTAACGVSDFYEKDYVLYDDTGTAEADAGSDADRAPGAGPAEAASTGGAGVAVAAGVGREPQDDVERIFVLENLHDELARAIRDGVGDLAALEQKQQDVAREIQWRKEAAGEAYDAARRARLEALRQFPVVVK